MKKTQNMTSYHEEPQRKLSWLRVLFAILLLTGMSYLATIGVRWWSERQVAKAQETWFAPYVDVTSKPTYDFAQTGTAGSGQVLLSFIVSSPTDSCQPSWGGYYSLDEAQKELDLDRRIARLRQQEGNIAVSFGGLKNNELAVSCLDHKGLVKAYETVSNRYAIDTIDLDLENTGLTDIPAMERRAKAIAELQSNKRARGENLAVWLTLPVAPQGLTQDGTTAISIMLKNGVDVTGVNVMTMNYSQSKDKNTSMYTASAEALTNTHRQLTVLYKQAGIQLGSAMLWKKIGVTPMIGQNDVWGEVFTLDDAEKLNVFALSKGLGRISMWSANRDIPCGENYVDQSVVSDSCSGFKQDKMSFAVKLSKGISGMITQNASVVTKSEPTPKNQIIDKPETSPYQIWQTKGAYLQGTKVVWRRNVYEAKWWTQGDVPDNPVLQAWETPWKLIGPVLPGEKPVQQPSLPEGTYPLWDGNETYEASDRVIFEGTPYQAKWWTQGDSPAAASANADNSPWVPLTKEQIESILTSN